MNLNQSFYANVSYKIKCDFGNFQDMSAKNYFFITDRRNSQNLLSYLDRDERWVLFILAEYININPGPVYYEIKLYNGK